MTWLMALCMVGSAVARIAVPVMKGYWDTLQVWSQIVLPIAATMLAVLIVLFNGKEMFYKTAIPVVMMAIFYAIQPHALLSSSSFTMGLFYTSLVFFCLLYTILSCGKLQYPWMLSLLMAAPLVAIGHFMWESYKAGGLDNIVLWTLLPDALLFIGCLMMCFAIRVHPQGEYHPTWGDRNDGRRVRSLDPMTQIGSYFQVNRTACMVHFQEAIEISNVEQYIRQKRREGITDFGINHVLLAAYVRCVAKYPQINRFISGQKIFSRGSDIVYNMTIKKQMTMDAPDEVIKVHLTPADTAVEVYQKMNAEVERVKKPTEGEESNFDSTVTIFSLIPGLLLKFAIWLLKLLDYFGLLPKFLLEVSPFHGSIYFTSLGSLGLNPVYHHLYDFGNVSIFGAFGKKRRALEVQEDGSVVQKKYIDMKFVVDERIVDGYGYAAFFKYYRRLLQNPYLLDERPEVINQDIY